MMRPCIAFVLDKWCTTWELVSRLVLRRHLLNTLALGSCRQRLGSAVVQELVENALDAGATSIEVLRLSLSCLSLLDPTPVPCNEDVYRIGLQIIVQTS